MRLTVAASAALALVLAPAELTVRAAAPEGDGLQEFENCYIGAMETSIHMGASTQT